MKTVVITGSTKGIGYGLALRFLKKKHRVVINGRKEEDVIRVTEKLRTEGYEVFGVSGDVRKPETFQTIIENTVRKYQTIDIWINNAGVTQSMLSFNEIDDQEIRNLLEVNVQGLMSGSKAAINFFIQQGHGKLFNMEGFGSDGRTMNKLTLYGTSKRAVNYFTKSLSEEMKGKNIQVGILSPGMVRTDLLLNSLKNSSEEDKKRTQKIFDILAEDVEPVTKFLVNKMLLSKKQYDRIQYLTFLRFLPKLIKLIFVR